MPTSPYDYTAWSNAGTQTARPEFGGTRTISSGYAYNPNWGTQDYLKANTNPLTGKGGVGVVRAFTGRSAFKKARGQEDKIRATWDADQRVLQARNQTDYLNAVDPTSRVAQYAHQRSANGQPFATSEELQAVSDLDERDKLRGAATHKINDYFGDPARAAEYERLTQDQLKADTQNIGTNYDNADTKMKLNAARQGLTGGSVEAENSTSLGGQRSAALIDAAQGANKTYSNLTARDRSIQDQLLTLVNSDDPYTRQAAQAQLQGMSQQTANDAYQEVANQTRRDANQFNQNQMSQSIGGGLTGLSNLIQQDPNRGSSLSAWYTPARS